MHDIVRRGDGSTPPRYPDNGWPAELALWRVLPAESFGPPLRRKILDCVAEVRSTMPEWCDALDGDASAAIRVALSFGTPGRFTIRGDLAMTILLARALNDARAAVVLSQTIRQSPLLPRTRDRLATSWLAHNLRRLERRRGNNSIAWKLMHGGSDL